MRLTPYLGCLNGPIFGLVDHPRVESQKDMQDSPADASAHHSLWASTEPDESHAPAGTSFTIGELARDFGVTLRALRFYENKGLLSPQRDGLNRLYSQRDRSRLALILKGKKLGFTLAEIQQMIAAEEGGRTDPATLNLSQEKCLEQIELLERQKAELDEGLAELTRIYTALAGKPLDRTGS
jgi:DNA-binding transcriptional MerR regulator